MSDQSQDPGPQLYASLPIPRDSQSIRVLNIPAKGSATGEGLTGSLRLVDLKDSPRFTALSYVWGQSAGKSITCNGYDIRITDSCFEALSSLRNTLGNFTIWVDAVCINQRDDDEKAAQIALMEQIYTFAEAVYIWLGPSTATTKKAFECIRLGSQYRLVFMGIPWRNGNRPMTMFQDHVSLCKRRLIALFPKDSKENSLLVSQIHYLVLFFLTTFGSMFAGKSYSILLSIHSIQISAFLLLIFGPLCFAEFLIYERLLFVSRLVVAILDKIYTLRALYELRDSFKWVSSLGIMDQRWLQRSWTFQEISLASNPILVFGRDHISWLELHQGISWAHDLEHMYKGYIDRPFDHASMQAIKKWLSLCNVWQTVPRPCRWNGNRFRVVLDESRNFKDDCSVREYLQTPSVNRFRVLVEVYTIFFLSLVFPSLYTMLVGPLARRNDGERGLYEFEFVFLFSSFLIPLKSLEILQSPWQGRRIMGVPKDFGRRSHLVGLAQAMRERECNLKNDRVFAVSAILQRLSVCQPMVDYSRPPGQIYHESFTGLVEWEPSFISLLIDTGSRLPGAPSWVPDWSTVAQRSWLSSAYIYDSVQVPQWSSEELSISITGSILSVQAAFLQTATHCTAPFRKVEVDLAGDAIPGMEENLLHNIQTLCQWVMRVRRDVLVDSIYDSIPLGVLSILSGHHLDRSEIDPGTQQVFNKVYPLMKRHSSQLEKELETMTGIVPATRVTFHDMAADKPSLTFIIDTCNELAAKRGLFLCSGGSIGSGPGTMLEGDSIALIKGVAVPMVLRRQSDDAQRDVYTVVGPSYIEGLMGLDVKELGRRRLDWKQIDLV